MLKPISRWRALTWIVVITHGLSLPMAAAAPGLSLLNPDVMGRNTAKEYYTNNKNNRFLIRVHVWGDITLSGVHHVPDDSSLLDVLSYAGGPIGYLSEASVSVTRAVKKDAKDGSLPQTAKIEGKDLVANMTYRNFPLSDGDVIYLEAPPKTDSLSRNLTIIATVVGIISASATLYLIARSK